jgi:tetratricopeptide (TPR) repeat protein
MRRSLFVSACILTAWLVAEPAAAPASVLVIGSSPGFSCYAVARSRDGSRDALERCNEAFESGTLTFEDKVATYVNRGIVRLYGKDHQGAIADFDRAIALNPSQPESYLNKGAALVRMGASPSEAIAQFNEALARKTSRPELAYFSRGVAYEVAGNLSAAYRDFKRAQELAPRWKEPGEELSRFQVTRVPKQKM